MGAAAAGGEEDLTPPPRTRRPSRVVTAAAVLVGGALVVHFAVVVSNVTRQPIPGVSRELVRAYLNPSFPQNWRLFAPDLATSERLFDVRGAAGETGEGALTDWQPLGRPLSQPGDPVSADYRRADLMASNALRRLELAEADLREHFGQPAADPEGLALDPRAPASLVDEYEAARATVTRLAAAEVERSTDAPPGSVQIRQTIVEFAPFAERTRTPEIIYERELPWWAPRP